MSKEKFSEFYKNEELTIWDKYVLKKSGLSSNMAGRYIGKGFFNKVFLVNDLNQNKVLKIPRITFLFHRKPVLREEYKIEICSKYFEGYYVPPKMHKTDSRYFYSLTQDYVDAHPIGSKDLDFVKESWKQFLHDNYRLTQDTGYCFELIGWNGFIGNFNEKDKDEFQFTNLLVTERDLHLKMVDNDIVKIGGIGLDPIRGFVHNVAWKRARAEVLGATGVDLINPTTF